MVNLRTLQHFISFLRFISKFKLKYLLIRKFLSIQDLRDLKKFFTLIESSLKCLIFYLLFIISFWAFYQSSYSQCPWVGWRKWFEFWESCKNVMITLLSLQLPFNSILLYFQQPYDPSTVNLNFTLCLQGFSFLICSCRR